MLSKNTPKNTAIERRQTPSLLEQHTFYSHAFEAL